MKFDESTIVKHLRQTPSPLPPDGLFEKIMSDIPNGVTWHRHESNVHWFRFSMASVLIMILLGVVLMFYQGNTSLYAQAREALEKAQSYHINQKNLRNGQWVTTADIWYQNGFGTVKREYFNDHANVIIDNGKEEWKYSTKSHLIGHTKSSNYWEAGWVNVTEWLKFNPKRALNGDKLIDGEMCENYILHDGSKEAVIWVDELGRIRELVAKEIERDQEVKVSFIIQYDMPVNPSLYSIESRPDSQIINTDDLLYQQYSLDKALLTKELTGFVFAVHEVKKIRAGAIYALCSIRLTKSMKSLVPASDGYMTYYGGFDLSALNSIKDENGYLFIPSLIARMRHGDLQVDWVLLIPNGPMSNQISECDLLLSISVANDLEKILKSQGKVTRAKEEIRIPIKNTDSFVNLEGIIENVYAEGRLYEPFIHSFLMADKNRNDENPAEVWRKPGETSVSEILKASEWSISYYSGQDKE